MQFDQHTRATNAAMKVLAKRRIPLFVRFRLPIKGLKHIHDHGPSILAQLWKQLLKRNFNQRLHTIVSRSPTQGS